jgi:hypothetical protein
MIFFLKTSFKRFFPEQNKKASLQEVVATSTNFMDKGLKFISQLNTYMSPPSEKQETLKAGGVRQSLLRSQISSPDQSLCASPGSSHTTPALSSTQKTRLHLRAGAGAFLKAKLARRGYRAGRTPV